MQLSSSLILAGVGFTTAHYSLHYPEWRADTLAGEEEYSQWTYPCAGVEPNARNRTEWPLDGGSLVLGLNHDWTYIFVNLGLGSNASTFNISLTPLLNSTGNGTLCIPKITLPATLNVQDGDEASIQVVTPNERGQALYNCADIKFSANANALEGDQCESVGVTYEEVVSAAAEDSGSEDSEESEEGDGDGDGTSAAAGLAANVFASTSIAALVMAVMYGARL